jgi:hypothetical protein
MLLKEYLEVYKFKPELLNVKEITDVRVQAYRHYYRDDSNDLGDAQRPSESKLFKEWRKANKRAVNHEILDTAISDSTSIINSNKFVLSDKSIKLETWLSEQRFYYLDSSLSFWDYFMRCIYPKSVLDPNGKIIVFPYNKTNKELPPNLIDPTEQAGIDIRFIRSDKILQTKSDYIFGFEAGEKKYNIKGSIRELKYYYICDYQSWYILEPVSEEKGIIQYSIVVWYNHNTNDTPVISPIGILTENIKGQAYQESVFRTVMPYLDEFVNSLGDNQVMRTKSSHAILVLPQTQCGICKGEKIIFENTKTGESIRKECPSCHGTGHNNMPGIADVLVLPNGTFDERGSSQIPVYIEPALGSLQHSWDVTWELLSMAGASIGINPLIKNNESGEAMKMRMVKWETKVNQIYQLLMDNVEDILTCVEAIVNPTVQLRKQPKVVRENRITIKTDEYLKLRITESLPLEKSEAMLDYYKFKYVNNPILVKIFELILKFYPQSTLENEEIANSVGFGRYDINDIKKADLAKMVYEDLAFKYGESFLTKPLLDLYKEGETILNSIIEPNTEPIPNGSNQEQN